MLDYSPTILRLFAKLAVAVLAVAAEADTRADASATTNLEVFDAVWHQVSTAYYDPTFGGKDWIAVGERYRDQVPEVESRTELRKLLARMLNELGESHFAIVPGSYDGTAQRRWAGGELGLTTTLVGKKAIVFRVDEKGPAWEAGIRPGFVFSSINGVSTERLRKETLEAGFPRGSFLAFWHNQIENQLGAAPGETVEMTFGEGWGAKKKFTVVAERYEGRMSQPFGYIPALPLELTTELRDDGIAYLRFNLWFPALMPDIRSFLRSLEGRAKGLVIDVRGNPGGIGLMATGVAGLISDEEFTLGQMSMRQGFVNLIAYPQSRAFGGPVAVLIDGLSLSTTEIFAAAMKEIGRARLFGSKTGGAALPSGFVKLPNGDKLQMAFANYVTDAGNRLEGVGVEPDEKIALSPKALRNGTDSAFAAARAWLLDKN